VLSNSRPPRDAAPSGAGSGTAPAAADNHPGRRLIAVLLLAAAALDLTRCSLVMVAGRYPAPAAGLAAAGLAAAALTVRTARGCQAGQRGAGWTALLIGAASAPQAAASGFHAPYTIPDTATAALGILLTVAVLATAGRTRPPGHDTENPYITSCRDCAAGERCVPAARLPAFRGRRFGALVCLGRTTVKWRRSRVATSVSVSRSAMAVTEASTASSGRSGWARTSSAMRAIPVVVTGTWPNSPAARPASRWVGPGRSGAPYRSA
jgi:hypothetical protein